MLDILLVKEEWIELSEYVCVSIHPFVYLQLHYEFVKSFSYYGDWTIVSR